MDMMLNLIDKNTTTKKRNKRDNAFKGAEYIIDHLGGIATYNEDAHKLKIMLHDFMRNPKKYEVKNKTFITRKKLRSTLTELLPGKSEDIAIFIERII